MTDPKNHDDEPEDITSSGEPDDAETDLDSTGADATDDGVDDETTDVIDDDTTDDDALDVDDERDDDDSDDDDERERKAKPVPTGKASRSGNPARAAEAEDEPRSRKPAKPQKIGGNRWAAPAMLTCAAIGLVWIVLYYVFSNRDNPIPVMSDLGDWNLIIGMGFIVAAFGFSMKWE